MAQPIILNKQLSSWTSEYVGVSSLGNGEPQKCGVNVKLLYYHTSDYYLNKRLQERSKLLNFML
jgi:hypothetical protein